MGITNGKADSL